MTLQSRLSLAAYSAALAATVLASRAQADSLYVSDSLVSTIYVYDSSGNQSVFAQADLSGPRGLAFDSTGNLYVANYNLANILQYTPPSNVDTVFASGSGLQAPLALTADVSGNLLVGDGVANAIFKIDPSGTVQTFASGLNRPAGLAFDTNGVLYESDSNTGTINRFNSAGTSLGSFASGLQSPAGIVFDASGNLYVADTTANDIFKYAADGTKSTFATGLNAPIGLAFDSAGSLYEADNGSGKIFAFDPTTGAKTLFAGGLDAPTYLAFSTPVASVPEQGSLALLGEGVLGLLGLLAIRRRRK